MLQSESEELTIQGFKTCCDLHRTSNHDIPHKSNVQMFKDGMQNLEVKLFTIMKRNQELLYINKKWAEQYNILKQLSEWKIKQMRKRLKHYEQKKEDEVRTMESASDITEQSMKEEKMLKTDTDMEVQFLRVRCDTLTKKVRQQEEEIKKLYEALLALKSSEFQQKSKKTEEDIWRHQAEVYKEDFLKERRDRNKLKEKYIMLENRFKNIHSEHLGFKK